MTEREAILKGQGWEKRFIASEPRLSEAIELYQSIGFDVLLEPLPDEKELANSDCSATGCTACFEADRDRYRIIFTRARKGGDQY